MASPTDRPKRFYKAATADALDGGFAVLLDGRPPRTPAGARLVLPTLALAQLIAAEWAAQAAHVALDHMPATRLAYTALDRIAAARPETVGEIVDYANADLLCYRAPAPATLTDRQARDWDPLLDWAGEALGLSFTSVTGVIHQPQSEATLEGVAEIAGALDDFALAGLAYATVLFGSAILALAVAHGRLTAQAAFDLSRLDEAFQEAQWGVDAEAAERTARRRGEAEMIGGWFGGLQNPSPSMGEGQGWG
jgi:chaperone required for assembly of F1-ATPase